MATDMNDTSPMECERDTGAFDLEESERYKSLMEGMRSAIPEMKELPDGFAFRFPSDPTVIVPFLEVKNPVLADAVSILRTHYRLRSPLYF